MRELIAQREMKAINRVTARTIERRTVMALSEANLRDDYQVWGEFIDRYQLDPFQYPGNHNQITKAQNFSEFQAPTDEWMKQARSSRRRFGADTPDQYTIVLDNTEDEQQLRHGLSSPGKKDKFVKLYVGRFVAGDVENIQWPIGRVDF